MRAPVLLTLMLLIPALAGCAGTASEQATGPTGSPNPSSSSTTTPGTSVSTQTRVSDCEVETVIRSHVNVTVDQDDYYIGSTNSGEIAWSSNAAATFEYRSDPAALANVTLRITWSAVSDQTQVLRALFQAGLERPRYPAVGTSPIVVERFPDPSKAWAGLPDGYRVMLMPQNNQSGLGITLYAQRVQVEEFQRYVEEVPC